MNIEEIRKSLQSFVGIHIDDMEVSERQKEAIQRLMCLPDEKFDNLCNDVVNEINRRSGLKHAEKGPMQEKLGNLSLGKFKNLVFDVLLVYNYRNSGGDKINFEEFISHLDEAIAEMKMHNKNIVSTIRQMDFLSTMKEYHRYVTMNYRLNPELKEEISEKIELESKNKVESFVYCLSHPKEVIKYLDSGKMKGNDMFQYKKDMIMRVLGDGELTHEKRSILKSEMITIFSLMAEEVEYQEKSLPLELGMITEILEDIRKDICGEGCVNLEEISGKMSSIVDSLILQRSESNDLKLHKVALESLDESVTKMDAFEMILKLAQDVNELFEQ